jgi:S1-C subfamily serine protease
MHSSTPTITNKRTCVPIASQIMDAWNKYNMARLRFGLDAELDPYQLALAQQTNDKNINEKMRHYLLCLKFRRADGSLHAAGSAFYVKHGFHLAVTAAHVTSMAGTDKIVACYPDGTQSDVIIIGQDPVADISVIKVDRSCPLPNLRHNAPSVGDTVYILGFSSGSELNFTKGMVTSMEQAAIFTTDAYADNGFSGGPVFNLHMEIVGMVKGGAGFVQGITNQQVRCINVAKVEGFVSGMMALSPGCGSWP